jgi:hypothetical protein
MQATFATLPAQFLSSTGSLKEDAAETGPFPNTGSSATDFFCLLTDFLNGVITNSRKDQAEKETRIGDLE